MRLAFVSRTTLPSQDAFDEVVRSGPGGLAPGIRVSETEHERYIELMAMFDAGKVYTYLISNNTYRLEFALGVCEKYGIVDGASYLKERTGDVVGALNLITKVRLALHFVYTRILRCYIDHLD